MRFRTRRRELLLEIMNEKDFIQQDIFVPDSFVEEKKIIFSYDTSFILQDRFCLKMETKDFIVNPERIKGFKIETIEKRKVIKVKTYLKINEWIKDFEKIEIIKIYFFDSYGNLLKNGFDYDVDYLDFTLECDYKFRDYLVPIFSYEILGI